MLWFLVLMEINMNWIENELPHISSDKVFRTFHLKIVYNNFGLQDEGLWLFLLSYRKTVTVSWRSRICVWRTSVCFSLTAAVRKCARCLLTKASTTAWFTKKIYKCLVNKKHIVQVQEWQCPSKIFEIFDVQQLPNTLSTGAKRG